MICKMHLNCSSEEKGGYYKLAIEAIKEGKVAGLLVAGGQGTRLEDIMDRKEPLTWDWLQANHYFNFSVRDSLIYIDDIIEL